MGMAENMPLDVRLSDGRAVNLGTVDGATNFLLKEGLFSLVRACEEIRREAKDEEESWFLLLTEQAASFFHGCRVPPPQRTAIQLHV